MITSKTDALLRFADSCDSDLRWLPVGTAAVAKAPMNVLTGGALSGWQGLVLDSDQLREHVEGGSHEPRAIGINLKASGVVALDCDAEGWLEDLSRLAGCEPQALKEELKELSRVVSPRIIVGKQQAIKFLFRLSAEVLGVFEASKPGLQITEGDNEKKWGLFAAGKQVVVSGEYADHGVLGSYSPTGLAEIKDAGPLLTRAILARLEKYSEKVAPTTGEFLTPASDLAEAVRHYLYPVADQFSAYDDWLKTGMAFHSLGDDYLPVWLEFCSFMDGFDQEECLDKWASFERREGGIGAGSLYFWLTRQGWKGGDELKRENPIEVRIELLQEGLLEITRTVRSSWKRRAHADDLNDALGKPVKSGGLDAALAEAIASVRAERSVTPRRASDFDSFISEADTSAAITWLAYRIISMGDSHLLVAPAKNGKTASLSVFLMTAMLGQISSMEERPGTILWYSDDQARSKTAAYLRAAVKGLVGDEWDPPMRTMFDEGKLIVDDRFDLTPDGVEELIEEVRKAYRPVVVLDSLASVCRKLGLKENDSSFANVIYDLTEAVKEANSEATLIIIHHSAKGGMKDRGALESVRGSGAIVGAVDNIINIEKPVKTSKGGNASVSDDQSPEREIHVNGRIPGGKYFIDLEFETVTVPDPQRPGKTYEKLDTMKVTRKAESTYQEGSETSLGSFQDQVLEHLREFKDQEWTTTLIAADLGKSPPQVSAALKRLKERGKVVSRPGEGKQILYQAT